MGRTEEGGVTDLEFALQLSINMVRLKRGLPVADFTLKTSGERKTFSSGMQRDVDESKVSYSLVYDGPMLQRYARHLTLGAKKYSPRNWMQASTVEEMERFRDSAARHFTAWMNGERDEDHMAACIFNLNGYEYVRDKLNAKDIKQETT